MDLRDDGWYAYDKEEKQWVKVAELVTIARRFKDAHTNEVFVDIALDGEVVTTKSMEVLSKYQITKLNKFGIPISPKNSDSLSTALTNEAYKLDEEIVFKHTGVFNHINQKVFVGQTLLCPSLNDLKGSLSRDSRLDLAPVGAIGDWKTLFTSHVQGHEHLEFAVVLGISGIVTSYLKQAGEDLFNPVVHLYGNSSIGKTTMATLALSVAGNPASGRGLHYEWNATENAISGILSNNYGIPILFDELSMGDKLNFRSLIYSLAEGLEKARSNTNLTVNEQSKWRTTIISTGETSFEDMPNAATNVGAKVRYMEISAQFTDSAIQSETIKRFASKNYGFVLPLVAEKMLSLDEDQLIERFESLRKSYVEKISDSQVAERISKQYAMFSLTAWLFNQTFEDMHLDEKTLSDLLIRHEEESSNNRMLHEKAYEALLEGLIGNQSQIYSDTNVVFPSGQLLGFWFLKDETLVIKVLRGKFNQMLSKNKIEGHSKVLKELMDHDLVLRADDARIAQQVTVHEAGTEKRREAFYQIVIKPEDRENFMFYKNEKVDSSSYLEKLKTSTQESEKQQRREAWNNMLPDDSEDEILDFDN